jgi:hypothetical protein
MLGCRESGISQWRTCYPADWFEIDKAQAPAGLRRELQIHGQIPRSQSPGPILTPFLKWERSQGLPMLMLSTLYFQLQRHGLLEKNRYHLLFESGFPRSPFGDSLQLVSLLP